MSYQDRSSKIRRSDDRVAALDRLAQYLEDHKGWNSESARLRSSAGNIAALNEADRNEAPVIMTGQRLDFNAIGQASDPRLNKILMEMRGEKVKEAHASIDEIFNKEAEVEIEESNEVLPTRSIKNLKKESSAEFKTRMLKETKKMGLYD